MDDIMVLKHSFPYLMKIGKMAVVIFMFFLYLKVKDSVFFKNANDYFPLVSIKMTPSKFEYSSTFNPKYQGRYLIAFRVKKKHMKENNAINIKVSGIITLEFSDGSNETIGVEKNMLEEWHIPTFYNDFRIVTFDIDDKIKRESCRARFAIKFDGNINTIACRELESLLIVRYDEGK